MIPFCRPLTHGTRASIEERISESLEDYPYVEIWAGGVADGSPEWASNLAARYPKRLVFVLREPGTPPKSLQLEVCARYQTVLEKAPCHIDIDLDDFEAQGMKRLVGEARLIISSHDFLCTPSLEELRTRHGRMRTFHPSIVKFATFAETQTDALRLIQFFAELQGRGANAIVIGMGEAGRIVRILNAYFGAPLVYAPESNFEANAPGQLAREELQRVVQALEGKL